MPITFTCSSCGKKLKAPDDLAGKMSRCPSCGNVSRVPEEELVYDPEPIRPAADLPAEKPSRRDDDEDEDRRPCPACGEMIKNTAVKCRFCGEIFDETLKRSERKKARRRESEPEDSDLTGADIALAILCSGIGCLMGIVWLIQGKPKGGKMLGLSLLFAVIWNVLNVIIQSAANR